MNQNNSKGFQRINKINIDKINIDKINIDKINIDKINIDKINIDNKNVQKNFVYIIRHGNQRIYKIGISDKPEKRVKQLQTGNPYPLKIIFQTSIISSIHCRKVESVIHKYLKEKGHWIRGEWFRIEDNDLVFMIAKQINNMSA